MEKHVLLLFFRFMICCDKCEEWFHGKCVGVTKARGAEMEKNNEDYVCPQCIKQALIDQQVTSSEVPEVSWEIVYTTRVTF